MKQSEVLALLHDIVANNQEYTTWTVSTPHLVTLVNKAVEAEREACAELCEQMDHDGVMIAADCAEAIRARGNT